MTYTVHTHNLHNLILIYNIVAFYQCFFIGPFNHVAFSNVPFSTLFQTGCFSSLSMLKRGMDGSAYKQSKEDAAVPSHLLQHYL